MKEKYLNHLKEYLLGLNAIKKKLTQQLNTNSNQLLAIESKIINVSNQIETFSKAIENPSIQLHEVLSEDQFYEYTLFSGKHTHMLFDTPITFSEWIDWFHEEIPLLSNKYLSFLGIQSNIEYNITDIPSDNLIQVNKDAQFIWVHSEPEETGEPIFIGLNGVDLFEVLSVEYAENIALHTVQKYRVN